MENLNISVLTEDDKLYAREIAACSRKADKWDWGPSGIPALVGGLGSVIAFMAYWAYLVYKNLPVSAAKSTTMTVIMKNPTIHDFTLDFFKSTAQGTLIFMFLLLLVAAIAAAGTAFVYFVFCRRKHKRILEELDQLMASPRGHAVMNKLKQFAKVLEEYKEFCSSTGIDETTSSLLKRYEKMAT